MFFLFWHQVKDEIQKSEMVMVRCRKCGNIIQSPVSIRKFSGFFLFIPYRFRYRFVRCPSCGHRQKLKKEMELGND